MATTAKNVDCDYLDFMIAIQTPHIGQLTKSIVGGEKRMKSESPR